MSRPAPSCGRACTGSVPRCTPTPRAVRLTDEGLRLDNGYTLPTDLVVLTAGGRPATALAKRAGLYVRRGVVVDDRLRSVTDERVHALGDCAEHRSRTTGFVPPAWEQASVLAGVLAGEDRTYDGSRVVARLRATGLDVAVMGDPERTEGEVVEVANPVTGSYRKVVVRRRARGGGHGRGPLPGRPADPAVRPPYRPGPRRARDAADGRPARRAPALPDDAEVCACAGASAGRVRACADLAAVVATTRATTGCGGAPPPSGLLGNPDGLVPTR